VIGPIVGGLLLVPFQTFLVQQYGALATGFDQILFGGVLLVVILLLPEGIVPSLRKRWQVWKASRTRMQTPVMGTLTPSFATISIDASERSDVVDVKETRELNVPVERVSDKIDWAIPPIPARQSVMLHPSMIVSQRVKAQRLVPLSTGESMTEQEPATFTPVISWRCPVCRRPFLLRGNICYCPQCGLMRPLAKSIS
jgi:hypothetical protein